MMSVNRCQSTGGLYTFVYDKTHNTKSCSTDKFAVHDDSKSFEITSMPHRVHLHWCGADRGDCSTFVTCKWSVPVFGRMLL